MGPILKGNPSPDYSQIGWIFSISKPMKVTVHITVITVITVTDRQHGVILFWVLF